MQQMTEQEKANFIKNESEARQAFDKAIDEGRLSATPTDENYAGKYMYMGKGSQGIDTFKHRLTRIYLAPKGWDKL